MIHCTQSTLKSPECKRKKVQASFDGGEVTSDEGLMLLRQTDLAVALARSPASALNNTSRKKSCSHSQPGLLRRRIYGLCQGYEDLNDHAVPRSDPSLQTAAERDEEPAVMRDDHRNQDDKQLLIWGLLNYH